LKNWSMLQGGAGPGKLRDTFMGKIGEFHQQQWGLTWELTREIEI
jgi:hypothetical protein